ncbi:unnamed protein product [Anisakis simplex]|uniref:Cytochrome b5 n=1 Tax=Anisakis simplex TaxID=6269 RepID=A0A0M3J832_ANISI|nr:unnamed protein product [Anisakis simplex]
MVDAKSKTFTLDEIAVHNSVQSSWIVIDDKVYDVTKFIDQHPGGEEVILEQSGNDATESFYDVGHSNDAKEMAEEYLIGHVDRGKHSTSEAPSESPAASGDHALSHHTQATWSDIIFSPTWSNFLIPTAISILVYVSYRGMKSIFI